MKKRFLLLILTLCALALHSVEYQLPKALFITSGDGEGYGTVSDGVILSLQELNKSGAFVRLENRQILHFPKKLAQFTILIIPTTFGYHDADRRYSLSFLSDVEMQNISAWVKQGGTLVSDVYLGRNRLNGEDRISASNEMTQENWPMAQCFGVNLIEKNMQNQRIVSSGEGPWQGDITPVYDTPEWTLIPSKLMDRSTRILARWFQEKPGEPAITVHPYGAGTAILLATFNLIHPAGDGGFSNGKEIQAFYHLVYHTAVSQRKYEINLNPWKNGAQSAFCLTLDDGGSPEQYRRILSYIQREKIPTTIFSSDDVSPEVVALLHQNPYITLQSRSHSKPDFRTLSYGETVEELLGNSSHFQTRFAGFRYPFTNNSFWGMKALDELGFLYDSSIALNHLEFYRGSLFPYNIPIFQDGYYQSLDLLEISQIFHDDWYYFQDVLTNADYNSEDQKRDASRFDAYLQTLWMRGVRPNNGLMVFMGHPLYSGMSSIAMQPLKHMVETAREDGAWITSPDEVAQYWNQLRDQKIDVKEVGPRVSLRMSDVIDGQSFRLPSRPRSVTFDGEYEIIEQGGAFFLILKKGAPQRTVTLEF